MIKDLLKDKKAVLFDLDGTLIDSMWMWEQIDIEFLGRFGYELPDDLQKSIEGMGFSETAVYFKNRFQIPLSTDEMKDCWTQMAYEKYRNEVPLKHGAYEFLKLLKERNIRTGIATSNGRELVNVVTDSLQIGEYLDVIVTACDVKAGKPQPDIYLETARRLEVAPKDCLVIEDIPAGILAGKRAGMTVLAIEDDFSKWMKQEKESLADGFINDYFELI